MDKFILEIPNVFSSELCQNIINKFENDTTNHVKGVLQNSGNDCYMNEEWKSSTELNVSASPGWETADKKIKYYVKNAIETYVEHVKSILKDAEIDKDGDMDFVLDHTLFPLYFNNSTIQKIEKGKYYRWHQDYIPCQSRMFTCFVYLNTLEPDEGGTTDFVNGRSIRPEAGKMAIFPSAWPFIHTGRLIKADAKYILVTNIYRDCNNQLK
jgi:hypothetical protein